MAKAKLAIIGGTGFGGLYDGAESFRVRTPYGATLELYRGDLAGRETLFLPRHGAGHSVPPHRINYRANIYALHSLGIERVLATNAVGAINARYRPGDLVVPHDFIDFTKARTSTYYDAKPVTHIDVSQPYCPEIRRLMIETASKAEVRMWNKAILVCTEGPRYETAAEITMFRRLGCDIVGMTSFPEVVLARELEMCYATICYVSNMAAGMQKKLTATELNRISKGSCSKIEQLLIETVRALPLRRGAGCSCKNALQGARFK